MNMYDNRKDLLKMVQKYLQGNATSEEINFLENYYDFFDKEEDIIAQLQSEEKKLIEDQLESGIWEKIDQQGNKKIRPLWPRIAAAASILIAVSIGGYYILHKQNPRQQTAQNSHNDILPGTNKAILTLAGGKQIIVTSATNGTIAKQANMAISKTAGAQLSYSQTNQGTVGTTPIMNTLSTQIGAESGVVLSDGTEVKLDAASSITYPVNFTGKDRRVTVTGQVYFKVKYNAEHPFFVTANGQTTQDLGTAFNIDAYTDEPAVITTLVEGSVQVSSLAHPRPIRLTPGQQAVSANNNLKIEQGDPDGASSWANGYFSFNDAQITGIMKQLARWYNIDVVYDGKLPDIGFNGTISRYKNITQVLKMLETTQVVHFKIEGRRVTVIP